MVVKKNNYIMEKLELKHLAGYLPYEVMLKCIDIFENDPIFKITVKEGGRSNATIDWVLKDREHFKLILRPLSDLTKEIEVNGEKFVPKSKLNFKKSGIENIIKFGYESWYLTYIKAEKLLEWHFDIYGLIEKGLAIDINTLKTQP